MAATQDASLIEVITDDLWEAIVDHKLDFDQFLFLEPHDELVRYWAVEGSDPVFEARLADVLPGFGAISVFDWESFAEACKEHGYRPIFMEDPAPLFEWRESLNSDPGVDITPTFEGRIDREGNEVHTIRGFLPFQAQGVNFMNSCERAGYGQWSTGTGKSVLAEGVILLKRKEGFDLTLYVNKPGNLYNAARKVQEHTLESLESTVLWGTPKKRERILEEIEDQIRAGTQPILVMNAEKYKSEKELFKEMVTGRKVLTIFDEIPFRYSNRMTDLYRSTAEVYYTTFTTHKGKKNFYPKAGKDRTTDRFFLAMSATSMRNSPEDIFNQVRLMDSRIFGSINDFHNAYVKARDPWGKVVKWRNLDYFGAKYSHIVHKADKKNDPRIAAQFPKVLPPETIFCDLSDVQEKLYAKLQNEYAKIGVDSVLDWDEVLAAIGCFQMIVDNPRGVLDSAIRRERYLHERAEFVRTNMPTAKELKAWDKKHVQGSEVAWKLRNLIGDDSKFTDRNAAGDCIVEKMNQCRYQIENNEEKVIVFSDKNETLLPYIGEWFDEWGITYVAYHGQMSAKKRDEAQQEFRTNPDIKVFLSTDAGQDSIDLPEADLTINYNLPWTQMTLNQRDGRFHRIDSLMDEVRVVTLRAPNTCEDRRAFLVQWKGGLQDEVDGEIVEMAEHMSKADMLYLLTGDSVHLG